MIFLTAQPDDYYFLWQIELQLYNLKKLGIRAEQIHVLLAYNPKIGLRHYFKELINSNKNATFYTYPDFRKSKKYASSIRPHIIKQHIKLYPKLSNAALFYIDSDVLLRELPDFQNLMKDKIWYVSDTRSYLNSNYIKLAGSIELFLKMCKAVSLPPTTVMENNNDAGGAQYLMKNTSYEFWNKVESDCEALYDLMNIHNNLRAEEAFIQTKKTRSQFHGIQSWCSDMWSILWNGWLFGQEIKIHKELDFCWPYEPLSDWNSKKILHYSGVNKKNNLHFFCKGDFVHSSPFYEVFDQIDKSTCSFPITELICDFKKEINSTRTSLKDVTFLIPVRIDSKERLDNLLMVLRYLDKHFDTNIIIGESDNETKISETKLPLSCKLITTPPESPIFNHTKLNNFLLKKTITPIISIYDTDIVLPIKQITESVHMLRENKTDVVSPYDGNFISIDKLFKAMFGKILEPELLIYNIKKFIPATKRSWGGAIFMKRKSFIEAGMDNEYFKSWGPEDIERIKRMKNLGYTVRRIRGPLFHLPHERRNSGYTNGNICTNYMLEYFKISNMKESALSAYIKTWVWNK